MTELWYVPQVDDDRPHRIIGFPQAGAGCATFADCASRLPETTALWAANLPGRQSRFAEPARTELAPLIDSLVNGLEPLLDRPYRIFGYCSGALFGYLLTHAATTAGLRTPDALVVASYPAPHRARPPRHLHELPSDEFWREILSYGGVHETIAAQPGYREIFEPPLRGDYALLADFVDRGVPPLDVPIIAIGGRTDPVLDVEDLTAWSEKTTAGCEVILLDGDHWLLDTAPDALAAVLVTGRTTSLGRS